MTLPKLKFGILVLLAVLASTAWLTAQYPSSGHDAGGGSGGSGKGDVVGPAGATDTAVAVFDTTTGKLLKNSTCTIASGVLTCTGFASSDTTHSGGNLYSGLTSGSVGLAAADIAGTGIVYVLPSTNGVAGKILSDSGSTTCPTLVSGYPATCHLLSWVNGPAVIASGSTALDFASTTTGACSTVITVGASGVATTDVIEFTTNASIKAVTGYIPASTGAGSINVYPTTNNINFEWCNWTTGTIDPGSITVNYHVLR